MLYYSAEKGVQMIISLLKANGIRKVVASPGATNITMVASLQHDPFFEMYSCVDERAAAYMACGLSEESGEPVVLSCTGATSSRNYMPALTEAYYRHLPILVITSSQDKSRLGHLIPQVTDREHHASDVLVKSVHLQTIKDYQDEWDCNVKINSAIIALKQHGGGPSHINLTTQYNGDYSVQEIPGERKVTYYNYTTDLPELPKGRIAIFIGSHSKMTAQQTEIIDNFCAANNAVAFCDHTSNYRGKYMVCNGILGLQDNCRFDLHNVDLLIHVGGMSGSYFASDRLNAKAVWRVSTDGKYCDHYAKLTGLFEMNKFDFFKHYTPKGSANNDSYLTECLTAVENSWSIVKDLPFSNWWLSKTIGTQIPENSVIHFGILNSLRSWNAFPLTRSVSAYCNVGGFGIDGAVSTLLGASLVHKEKLYFGVMGDLAFFYDLNSMGNRHFANNVRILLVNNGCGIEFRNYNHQGAKFGEDTNKYIAAGGHFGHQSPIFVKHIAEDMGFEYISASSKEEFLEMSKRFLNPEMYPKPILFEVFTDPNDESEAFRLVANTVVDESLVMKKKIKGTIKSIIGEDAAKSILHIFKK